MSILYNRSPWVRRPAIIICAPLEVLAQIVCGIVEGVLRTWEGVRDIPQAVRDTW